MQYTTEITFTRATTRESQESKTLKCAKGVIHRIDVVFPAGCHGKVNVAIFVGGHSIAPSTEGQTYKGDDEVISIPEFIELGKELNIVTISGWNEDNVYEHRILIRIYVLRKKFLLPIGATEGIIAALKAIFRQR